MMTERRSKVHVAESTATVQAVDQVLAAAATITSLPTNITAITDSPSSTPAPSQFSKFHRCTLRSYAALLLRLILPLWSSARNGRLIMTNVSVNCFSLLHFLYSDVTEHSASLQVFRSRLKTELFARSYRHD